MGAVLGIFSLASWVPCLCSGASCLLCGCCPISKNSTVTRIIYAAILFLGTLVCCIMQTEKIETELKRIPGFCDGEFQIKMVDTKSDCDVLVGYKAVYRINFALAIFFFAFFLLMIKVKTSKDPRAAIHNGYVRLKINSFFMLFLVLLSVTSLFYILAIISVGLLYKFYTKPDGCTENKFFISINLILCVVVSVVSILPKVQEHQPHSGLLQSSIITLYTIYLTWSAMTNEPDRSCNPALLSIITNIAAPTPKSVNSTTVAPTAAPPSTNSHFMDANGVCGLLVLFCCLVYSSIRTSSNSQVNKLTLSGSDSVILGDTVNGAGDEEDGQPRRAVDNEKDGVQYNYSFFHLMLCCASLYIMMAMTNWYSPNANFQRVTSEWPAVWVKMGSSWACLLLYVWTLVAPLVLTGRDFS
ncbi:PREDICTED: serine incorporator 3 [Dipodomys ordii]|uniref:Serine incorporator 3 n=1 Tax=Dipodomys ordii TaxID=10020 RepID=A0A1S3ERU7_DIPOR|nr:PREDICTED: serine incorporator 3 [Dipodomys ordii]